MIMARSPFDVFLRERGQRMAKGEKETRRCAAAQLGFLFFFLMFNSESRKKGGGGEWGGGGGVVYNCP